MDLREYVFRKRITWASLAIAVGCSRNHLNRIGNGGLKCGIYLAKAISQATNGEVTVEEIMNAYQKDQESIK